MKRSCFVDAENVVGCSRIFSRKGVIKFRDLRGRRGRAQVDCISPSRRKREGLTILFAAIRLLSQVLPRKLSPAAERRDFPCGAMIAKGENSLLRKPGSIYMQKRFRRKDFCEKKKAAPRVAFHIVCVQIVFFQNAHFWVRKAMTSSAFMRTCSMLSLSRTVTVPSSSVVKSMVRQ